MRPMGGLGRHIVGLIPTYLPELWQHYILPVTAKIAPARIGRRGHFRSPVKMSFLEVLPYLRKVVRYQTNYVASKATHGPHQ